MWFCSWSLLTKQIFGYMVVIRFKESMLMLTNKPINVVWSQNLVKCFKCHMSKTDLCKRDFHKHIICLLFGNQLEKKYLGEKMQVAVLN